jgi:AraC family transcriptional regulator, regulatory protein of adaptative response / methylated-DNA-[protein]-cysteine methyltransferase
MNKNNPLPPVEEMQNALFSRDASYDGIFFTAVRTTGIFCRPSCSAKKPLANNVQYFSSVKEALFSGYRPCLRCKPMESHPEDPEWLHPVMARIEEQPLVRLKDSQIRAAGVDPARLRRHFLSRYGMTFQAFARARRMGHALQQIREGNNLMEVAMDQGYDSYSGFQEAFRNTFGDPPGRSRNTDCISVAWMESPLGPFIAGANSQGICFLEFTDRRMLEKQLSTLKSRFKSSIIPGNNQHLEKLHIELTQYFDGERKDFTVPLLYPGSNFQVQVWENLLKIPYGQTISYEALALRVGNLKAVRAVGTANGMNRICILIPCHRVVNKDGKLGGYGGGLWRKTYLLQLEQRNSEPADALTSLD